MNSSEKRDGLPSSAKLVSVRPATPLPWLCDEEGQLCHDNEVIGEFVELDDAVFAQAACNAYPGLVEALRFVTRTHNLAGASELATHLLRELGEL